MNPQLLMNKLGNQYWNLVALTGSEEALARETSLRSLVAGKALCKAIWRLCIELSLRSLKLSCHGFWGMAR